MSAKIDAQGVETVLRDCLFRPEESTDSAILVDAVNCKFGFHPQRLELHRQQVQQWLSALPHEFRKSSGGGWSFLQACLDEDGEQWGEHKNVQELLSLGMGLGLVKCQTPRELWAVLPGGMPYYVVLV